MRAATTPAGFESETNGIFRPLVAEELREELRAIHRKLDTLSAQLHAGSKRFLRSSTDPMDHRSERSSRRSQDSEASMMSKGVVDVQVVKALCRQSSMMMRPISNGLELVLTQQPNALAQSPSNDATNPNRLERVVTWGKSKSRLFSATMSDTTADNPSHKVQYSEDHTTAGETASDGDRLEDSANGFEGYNRNSVGTIKPRHSARQSVCSTDVQKAHERLLKKSDFSVRRCIWNFLDDPESSNIASCFARVMPVFLVSSTLITIFQAVEGFNFNGMVPAVIETAIDSIFLLELLLRLVCCPSLSVFFLSVYNWIDVAAAVPLAVRIAIGFVLPEGEVQTVPHGILLCYVPVVRLLKTLRRFEKFHLLLKAFELAAEALPVLLFILSGIALVFSVLIYLVEPRDNIKSLPHSFWLSLVTMTTVGYGDVTPLTGAGSCITAVLVVVTVLYMAIPLGIIGNAFTDTWKDRDRILLMQRTRERLRQWGYTAHDIPVLFRVSDSNEDGELDIAEFRKLLMRMQVGFSEERILKLFQSFDNDGNGTVDDEEFVRALFPEAYHEIYGHEDSPSEHSAC